MRQMIRSQVQAFWVAAAFLTACSVLASPDATAANTWGPSTPTYCPYSMASGSKLADLPRGAVAGRKLFPSGPISVTVCRHIVRRNGEGETRSGTYSNRRDAQRLRRILARKKFVPVMETCLEKRTAKRVELQILFHYPGQNIVYAKGYLAPCSRVSIGARVSIINRRLKKLLVRLSPNAHFPDR